MMIRISFAATLFAVSTWLSAAVAHEEDLEAEIALFNKFMNTSNIIHSDGDIEMMPGNHDVGPGWPTPDPKESLASAKMLGEEAEQARIRRGRTTFPRLTQPISIVNFHKRDGTGKRSFAEFKAQVDQLNDAYSGAEARAGRYGNAQDSNIRFKLAGVRYVANDDYFNYCTLPTIIARSRPRYMMDGSRHLNVYVCWCQNNLGMSWLPYDSWYRQNTNENHYALGAILHHELLPGNNFRGGLWSRGNILVHEIGHAFGLKHPYEGDCSGDESNSDQIGDTPRMSGNPLANCQSLGARDSCRGQAGRDDLGNYMVATGDSCRNHFTPGQIGFMQRTIRQYKPTLMRQELPSCVAAVDSSDGSPDLQPCLDGTIQTTNGRKWCRTDPDDNSAWAWACCPSGDNWDQDQCRQGSPDFSARRSSGPGRIMAPGEEAEEPTARSPSAEAVELDHPEETKSEANTKTPKLRQG